MSTINISIPQEQVRLVDKLTERFDFANRSEFIRALLRLVTHKPELVEEASAFPFEAPKIRSRSKILACMRKTGKYSREFPDGLRQGMEESDYFTP